MGNDNVNDIVIVISSNAEELGRYLRGREHEGQTTGTVEAEYGDTLVPGSEFSLAHHGPRADQQPPCLATSADVHPVDVIGISHFDLDTLMGIGVAMGRTWRRGFAEVVAFVDVNGVHRAGQCPNWEEEREFLQAFWAWSQPRDHRLFPPRNGSVADCTEFVEDALDTLERILSGDEELLQAGRIWAKGEEELNRSSFVEGVYTTPTGGAILLRQSEKFVNHLYNDPAGVPHEAIVGHNPKTGSIILSFADASHFTNLEAFADEQGLAPARVLVQKLWGPEAGGHAGIAGSPRGRVMTLDDARSLVEALKPYF